MLTVGFHVQTANNIPALSQAAAQALYRVVAPNFRNSAHARGAEPNVLCPYLPNPAIRVSRIKSGKICSDLLLI
jgi:hypothetical protein